MLLVLSLVLGGVELEMRFDFTILPDASASLEMPSRLASRADESLSSGVSEGPLVIVSVLADLPKAAVVYRARVSAMGS